MIKMILAAPIKMVLLNRAAVVTGKIANEIKMGRQINFFLSNGDQEELTQRLDSTGCVVAAKPPFPSMKIPVHSVSEFSRWSSGEHFPHLFKPTDATELILRRSNPELGYFIDVFRSPVIEFSRCIVTNDEIFRGRLYYIVGFIEDDLSKFTKSPEFVDWATKIFKIVRKLCVEKREGDYIGKEALEMEKHGYRLVSQ